MDIIRFQAGKLQVNVYSDEQEAGRAAALAAAESIRKLVQAHNHPSVIFATGASQLAMLRSLVEREVPWNRVTGFHLDEYAGLSINHPGSFRRYLRDHLIAWAQMRKFWEIDGEATDLVSECRRYAEALREASPQLCLLGIGENGHLAFNDPGEADFDDPEDVKIVQLDKACRQQQAAEGWFAKPEDVPERAITLTVPAIFRVPQLIISVPGIRKARIVRRTLHETISPQCPATILRTHPNATLYLDRESASELHLTAGDPVKA